MEHKKFGRTPARPRDQLTSLIREALAERIGDAEPPASLRQVLLSRAHEAQKNPKRRHLLYHFTRVPRGKSTLPFMMSGINTGFSSAPIEPGRDPYLMMAARSLSNPLLSLLR